MLKDIIPFPEDEPAKPNNKKDSKNSSEQSNKGGNFWKSFTWYSILIVLVMALMIFAAYKLNKFFDRNRLKNPVSLSIGNSFHFSIGKFWEERQIEQITVIKGVENVNIDEAMNLSAIVDGIYTLESSNGKHDACRAQGKFNGYGYRWNSKEHVCFNSHEEVQRNVALWFNEKIQAGYTLPRALCIYNQGVDTAQCVYAQNYKLVTNIN